MNLNTIRIAKIMNRAVQIREDSFDLVRFNDDRANKPLVSTEMLVTDYYTTSMAHAVSSACVFYEEPGMEKMITELMVHHFDLAIKWAKFFDPPAEASAKDIIDQYPALREGLRSLEYDNGSPPGWFDHNIRFAMKYINLHEADYSAQVAQNQTFGSLNAVGITDEIDESYRTMSINEYMAGGDQDTIMALVSKEPKLAIYNLFLDLMFGEVDPEELGLVELELVE